MSTLKFDELFQLSVQETITKVLGESVWSAISFYFDANALSKDSDALSEVLSRLFGVKAGVLENVIAEVLLTRLGVPAEKRKVSDFRSLVRIARAKFISSGSNVALTSP